MKVIRLITLLLLAMPAGAATVFFSQAGGSVSCGGDGTQATTALASVTWTAGNTYKLCGTITSVIAPNASGSAGNLITIQWESNGSVQVCNTTGAVNLAGLQYFLLDLGGNSTAIECLSSTGNFVGPSDGFGGTFQHIEIRNGTIGPLSATYVAASDGTTGIYCNGCNDVHIHSIKFTGMESAVIMHPDGIAPSTGQLEVDHNSCGLNSTDNTVGKCVTISDGTGGTTTNSGSLVHDNDAVFGSAWAFDSPTCTVHIETFWFLQFGGSASDKITGLRVYNNYIHGNFGACTSAAIAIYSATAISGSSSTIDAAIFNNVIQTTSTATGGFDALIFEQDGYHTLQIYNNVIDAFDPSKDVHCFSLNGQHDTLTLKNNVCENTDEALVSTNSGTQTFASDYNDWYNVASCPGSSCWTWNGTGYATLAAWNTGTGFDAHSITTIPGLNSNYTITSTGSAVYQTGTNLTGLGITQLDTGAPLTFGFSGACGAGCVARSSSGPWNIGAYDISNNTGVFGGLSVAGGSAVF